MSVNRALALESIEHLHGLKSTTYNEIKLQQKTLTETKVELDSIANFRVSQVSILTENQRNKRSPSVTRCHHVAFSGSSFVHPVMFPPYASRVLYSYVYVGPNWI